MKKDKKIFITGATGFVGSNLAYKLLREGYEVKLLVRRNRNRSPQEKVYDILFELCEKDLTEFKEIKKRIEVIEGDITDPELLGIPSGQCKNFHKEIGALFHCAAFMAFDKDKKDELFTQNVQGTKNVMEFILRTGIPNFHSLSTAYVCGRELASEITEETLDRPAVFNNPYEESKFETEKLVREYKKTYDMKTSIYRPSIIVGDSRTGRTQSLTGYYTVIRAMYILRERVLSHYHKNSPHIKDLNVRIDNGKLCFPLRVTWLKDKPLNLVPIDYVIDVIFEIFKDESLCDKTFYVINPAPPRVSDVLKYTCEALNISTFQIIDPKEFIKKPKTSLERFLSKNVKEYSPYLDIPEPRFKDINTPQAVKDQILPPTIDLAFISKLVNHCISSDWRRKIDTNGWKKE